MPAIRVDPAAFRRLCVETWHGTIPTRLSDNQPPSGGCVLKLRRRAGCLRQQETSRLQAAVC